jgi:hypothetical protein
MILNLFFFFTLLFLTINTRASEDDYLESECINEQLSVTVEYSPIRKISIKGAMSLRYWENNNELYNTQNQKIQKEIIKIFKSEYESYLSNQPLFINLEFYKCIISKKFINDIRHLIIPLFRGCWAIYWNNCMFLQDKLATRHFF